MRCHQCERPAIYRFVDDGPGFCLACADTLQSIADRRQSVADRQFLQNAAMLNLSMDEMDTIGGIRVCGPRIPVADIARAIGGKSTLNNITINGSNVGVLNTGDRVNLERIDAAITLSKNTDAEAIAAHLQRLTQRVVDTDELDAPRKREVLDLVEALAEQIVRQRKPSIVKSLIGSIERAVHGAASLVTIVEGLSSAAGKLFSPG
jgi:hypothetical protein